MKNINLRQQRQVADHQAIGQRKCKERLQQ
jgi:hypothetical protein